MLICNLLAQFVCRGRNFAGVLAAPAATRLIVGAGLRAKARVSC